jgi:hypothetical protein
MGNYARAIGFGFVLSAAAGSHAACSGNKEPLGALVVAVSSDMAIPKDIDHVGLSINVGDRNVFSVIDQVFQPGVARLPATIAVVAPKDGTQAFANVRLVGFSKGKAVIIRDARVGIPTQRRALFRLPLYFLSLGSGSGAQPGVGQVPTQSIGGLGGPKPRAVAGGDTLNSGFEYKCSPTAALADRAGECVSMDFSSPTLLASLPDYVAGDVFGTGAEPPLTAAPQDLVSPDGYCFPTDTAFARYRVIDIDPSSAECSVDTGVRYANIGLLTTGRGTPLQGPSATPGQLSAQGVVALDGDANTAFGEVGFRYEGESTKLLLPKGVCLKKGTATPLDERVIDVVGSNVAIPTKLKKFPPCSQGTATRQPLAEGAPLPGGPPDAGATIDSGRVDVGPVDAAPPPPPTTFKASGTNDNGVFALLRNAQTLYVVGGNVGAQQIGVGTAGAGFASSASELPQSGFSRTIETTGAALVSDRLAVSGMVQTPGSSMFNLAVRSWAVGASATESVSSYSIAAETPPLAVFKHAGQLFVTATYRSNAAGGFENMRDDANLYSAIVPLGPLGSFVNSDQEYLRLRDASLYLLNPDNFILATSATSATGTFFVATSKGDIFACDQPCVGRKLSLAAGNPVGITQGTVVAMTHVAGHLYFIYREGAGARRNFLYRRKDGDQSVVPVQLDNLGAISSRLAVATDGAYVYYSSFLNGNEGMYALPVGGGLRQQIATPTGAPTAITVSGSDLFWGDKAGFVYKRALIL